MRGTAQNPDVYFQGRESRQFRSTPAHRTARAGVMDEVAAPHRARLPGVRVPRPPRGRAGRRRDGLGRGDGARDRGHLSPEWRRVGVLQVRLYRPFPRRHLLEALPRSVRAVAVLDRTKEPGSNGEPLYLDVHRHARRGRLARAARRHAAGHRRALRAVVQGAHPAMAAGRVRRAGTDAPRRGFTVGITDDVGARACPTTQDRHRARRRGAGRVLRPGRRRHGRGQQEQHQDHRRGPRGARPGLLRLRLQEVRRADRLAPALRPAAPSTPYLVRRAGFVACHQFGLARDRRRAGLRAGGGHPPAQQRPSRPTRCGTPCPAPVQQGIIDKRLRLYAVDATSVARGAGCPAAPTPCSRPASSRSPASCPRDEAIARVKAAIRKTYGRRVPRWCGSNFAAVDATLAALHEVPVPAARTSLRDLPAVSRATPRHSCAP
jgi:pyruvate-ferredoxin/flavodoxin oxidoreductase